MAELLVELRNQLESVIYTARETGEAGARAALRALAVHHHEPFEEMSIQERKLRNRLRARGRQLGDQLDPKKGVQEIDCLAHDCAYQHWHRMLFARFLAENGFLIEPRTGVAITLAECHDLAREQKKDPWELASDAAQQMLPQIFRADDPALAVALPPEYQRTLETLLTQLPAIVFTADDSLGWTYQFWQTREKGRVNSRVSSGEKVTGRMLPAVTQLFTEHYMVQFLLHNSVGAWHASKVLSTDIAETALDESELRRAVSLEGYDFEYLRFTREEKDGQSPGPWRPAAGIYSEWPDLAREFKILDPCCGSGHFLVAVFNLLVRIRQAQEGIPLEEAIRNVLSDNIFGLELDPRCTQIAAFNIALAAWKMAGRVMPLPSLNLACSGLSVGATKEEWLKLANGNEVLQWGLEGLYNLFVQAPELGSLLNPRLAVRDMYTEDYQSLQSLVEKALAKENTDDDFERREIGIAAQGMAKAAELLDKKYTLVITNVPYLARSKQSVTLRKYCEKHHLEGKNDLATAFLDRCLSYCANGGTTSLVMPQNWLFLVSYKRFREKLLKSQEWDIVALLGAKGFQTPMWDFNVQLINISERYLPDNHFSGIDASAPQRPADKAQLLSSGNIHQIKQASQLENPDSRITMERIAGNGLLEAKTTANQGIKTGDDNRWRQMFWEQFTIHEGWEKYQSTVAQTTFYGGREYSINWTQKGRGMAGPRLNNQCVGRHGVGVSQMGGLPVTIFTGNLYDSNIGPIVPFEKDVLPAIWCFCSSLKYNQAIRNIDQKLSVANATLVKVPFDLDRWQKVAAEKYPHGLPQPFSDDPTQWIFHGHPCGSVIWDENSKWTAMGPLRTDSTVLQVAVARLLGYRWPAELDSELVLSVESREWVRKCDELLSLADADGIVCFAPLRGKEAAANRLRGILSASFGETWTGQVEKDLLGPANSMEDWLQNYFFAEHCVLFQHRPFVWHIWDGRRDGFNAFVNYHRLAGPKGEGRRTLEALTYSYLGEWIERQRAGQREGKEGADARLAAALDLQEQLQLILAGEPPYDIFVRWKPLHRQPLGWEPDINDGVRLNIRPFMSAGLHKGGRAGAGVLRSKPNINWNKDRGREPQSLRPAADYPWFWGCDPKSAEKQQDFQGSKVFDGNRWNDLHYTRAIKSGAREIMLGKGESDG